MNSLKVPLSLKDIRISDINKAVTDIKNIYGTIRLQAGQFAPDRDDFKKGLQKYTTGSKRSEKALLEIFKECERQHGQYNYGTIHHVHFNHVMDALQKNIRQNARQNSPLNKLETSEFYGLSIAAANLVLFAQQQLKESTRTQITLPK